MKRLLTILSAIAIGTGAMAQSGLTFGAKGGLNITNIAGDYTGNTKIGAHLGGIANYGFGRRGNFSALAELLYDMKGSRTVIGDQIPLNLHYLTVPIQARYRFKFGLYLEGGAYLSVLMAAGFDGESVSDQFSGTDIGMAGGAGYINDSGWGFGYRNSVGLKNIGKKDDDPNAINLISLNVASQLSFMWFFNWD